MRRRRKFELLLADLRRLLADTTRGGRDFALSLAIRNLSEEQLVHDVAKTRQVLEFACLLRASDAQGRQVAEERLLGDLTFLAGRCCDLLEAAEFPRVAAFPGPEEAPPALQQTWAVLRELHGFALGCFDFKRPRDSFGGRRRALAFEILGRVGFVVDLPDVVRMAERSLCRTHSVESRQASEFLRIYFSERSLSLNDEMVEELLSLAERTDSRSIAFQALNTLVATDAISEFEAGDRMDEWKSKHR